MRSRSDIVMKSLTGVLLAIVAQPFRIVIRLRRCFAYMRNFGVTRGARTLAKVLTSKGPLIQVPIPESETPITLRANTSDIPTFEQVFVWDDYDLPLKIKPSFIIDGGANIGCASVYFANRYPEARIVAVEPESSNVTVLRQNIMPYPNISVIQAGIWHKQATLEIENPEDEKWLFRVREAGGGGNSFKAITINDILGQSAAKTIDILKLDIEGAEKELFSCDYDWLKNVNVLIIELHDRYKPGCSEAFYAAVSKYNFSSFQKGENIILVREERQGVAAH